MSKAKEYLAGRRSRVIDLRGQTLALLEPEDLPPDAPKELRLAVQRANLHRWKIQLKYTVGLFVVIGGIGLVARWLSAAPFAGCVQTVVYAVTSLFLGTVGGAASAKESGLKAVAGCLKAGVCPSCGYSLRGLVEEDGAQVCPECGGVWRVG